MEHLENVTSDDFLDLFIEYATTVVRCLNYLNEDIGNVFSDNSKKLIVALKNSSNSNIEKLDLFRGDWNEFSISW